MINEGMTTRSRRRRFNTDMKDEQMIVTEQDKFKVKFVEEIDYKM